MYCAERENLGNDYDLLQQLCMEDHWEAFGDLTYNLQDILQTYNLQQFLRYHLQLTTLI